jgi:N-acetylmuramoyl-L-alanine amidase
LICEAHLRIFGAEKNTVMGDFIKKIVLFLSIVFTTNRPVFAQEPDVSSKIDYYQKKVKKYLDKENALKGIYSISNDGIKIYASAGNKAAGKAEFKINWQHIESYKRFIKKCSTSELISNYKSGTYDSTAFCVYAKRDTISKNKSGLFYGYRIAIDAGHTAGDVETGEVERKFLKFKPAPELGLTDSIAIAEGMITYATVALLKDKLEQEGAEVFLTRPFNGSTAYGETFDEWLKTSYKSTVEAWTKAGKISASKKSWYLNQAPKSEKFRLVFKDMELQKRADIINDFKPDFTVIIHYNVDETNTGWTKPGNKNFNMAFIGGAFMGGDLSTPEKRFEFLRMLVTDDLEASVELSGSVVQSLEDNLLVKPAGTMDATYLHKGCLYSGKKGVFCRNLQLTRNIHGPVVYGETLYQDNIAECVLLNQETDKLKNKRVQQAADAYYIGIKKYIENWKP